ncbi:Hpt domain-containing protein [Chelatococcus sp. GCM10030263]|uniref:Hpt domain-containing protein n=1 Tax=Chelatococcus sp. GCM10030263 TaxID=3273387 RepID=UPI00361F0B3A
MTDARFEDESYARATVDLDEAYLDRQTGGDRALAHEVLVLFRDQARRQYEVIVGEGDARTRRDAAHTLKGSARAIGAWRVAAIVQAIEVAFDADAVAMNLRFEELDAALAAADEIMQQILSRPVA